MKILSALPVLLAAALPARALYLNSDGTGQALIFPYYTVQAANGNPFNTYITIVNQTLDTKALRVRVREGRNSREVASFNLFLSPNDAWAGAVVPQGTTGAARLITADVSCTSPLLAAPAGEARGITFSSTFYTGVFADGNGDTLERTREGWVEVIEMATLTGASAARVAHGDNGTPADCAAMQGTPGIEVAAPRGGISGTLTLINVTSGLDFTVNAEALAELTTRPFYRPPTDQYPDLNALEIDPVSVVAANGFLYRSVWGRSVDAVSAVFMRSSWRGELVLDVGTASKTDFAVTFPTRQYYLQGGPATPPFSNGCLSADLFRGEPMRVNYFDREERGGQWSGAMFMSCYPVVVFGFVHTASQSLAETGVLGSRNRATVGEVLLPTTQSGWARIDADLPGRPTMTSFAASTRFNIATGASTTGPHVFTGLPAVGLMVRTFENGTLSCSTGACQGNYGGSYPLTFTRTITPAN